MKISALMIENLQKWAARKTWGESAEAGGDDFNPMDLSGGNYDDCYQGGIDDGYIELARLILADIGITISESEAV